MFILNFLHCEITTCDSDNKQSYLILSYLILWYKLNRPMITMITITENSNRLVITKRLNIQRHVYTLYLTRCTVEYIVYVISGYQFTRTVIIRPVNATIADSVRWMRWFTDNYTSSAAATAAATDDDVTYLHWADRHHTHVYRACLYQCLPRSRSLRPTDAQPSAQRSHGNTRHR